MSAYMLCLCYGTLSLVGVAGGVWIVATWVSLMISRQWTFHT